MAVVDFHERERLLASWLLNADDNILSPNRRIIRNGLSNKSIANGFSSSFGSSSSSWSSPIESDELGSTETESDEDDDFIAELTRQMADYMLEDHDENTAANCTSQDLNCVVPAITENPKVGFGANQASSYDQTPAIHLYKLEDQPFIKHEGYVCERRLAKRNELTQQLELKQHQQQRQFEDKKRHYMENRRGRADDDVSGGGFGPPATAWPPLQPHRQQQQMHQVGSGMRVVFLRGPSSKIEPSGTGVFLPRGTGDGAEIDKKPGCSTVLIPTRVMQALQLHFEDVNARSQSNGCGAFKSYPLHHGAFMARNSDMHLRQSWSQTRRLAVNHPEMVLPKEWTY